MIVQLLDGSEETLAAVAGMFHCKAKGTFYPLVCTTFSNHPASFMILQCEWSGKISIKDFFVLYAISSYESTYVQV